MSVIYLELLYIFGQMSTYDKFKYSCQKIVYGLSFRLSSELHQHLGSNICYLLFVNELNKIILARQKK